MARPRPWVRRESITRFLMSEALMKERVAVITGGAKGIGHAIGIALAQEAWSVAF